MPNRTALRRALMVASIAIATFIAFWIYARLAGGRTTFGPSWSSFAVFVVFAAVFTLPVLGVFTAPEALLIAIDQHKCKEAGACQSCAYGGAQALPICPECGGDPKQQRTIPSPFRMTRLAFALWVLSVLIGSLIGESWLLADEAAFRREVALLTASNGGPTALHRPRWWPGRANGLVYEPSRGFWGTD
jgi:hypothetical protein